MRLTQEIDYSFRIVSFLAQNEDKVLGAPLISEKLKVPERFTLRILRKLNLAGITGAKRGAYGGYYLKEAKENINLYDIILAVNGPIEINRCLHSEDPFCSRNQPEQYGSCRFHTKLEGLQDTIINAFKDSKITDFI
ncbi:Rrf2 family transcriptional regulator [Peptoniphilus sp. KCTC 25270]|uniref:RrF2 family transcriptional regulator n=1 Tax=Peptoniphilus sp. KCTC 25270 TaxID=2897414 RepID=UPI001E407FA6|nr:Rrf2 family transcriptional regulator [Peptoniphilus sp. KCTC 25270]MCD1146828.1 Rrf2 family transcriptional regulator [Peptoniphilus sp. KCTC 25270]